MLRLSRQLAFMIGTVTPAIETWRRWHELVTFTVWWPAFLDDVLLGAFLVLGAWLSRRSPSGRQILGAAWGFMCGVAYSSLTFQLANLDAPDPSGFSPVLVVAVKALGLVLGVVGVVSAIAAPPMSS
jgi:hypothetical protein